MKKTLEVLKSLSAILAALILILGQITEIGENAKSLGEMFTGSADHENE